MLGIFDVHTDVDARDCMLKYEHREQRAGPDAQSTELHPRPESANKTEKCCWSGQLLIKSTVINEVHKRYQPSVGKVDNAGKC